MTPRVATSRRRRSAGTMLPASSKTMSPGTSLRAGISCSAPSRRTRTMGLDICLRAAMAFSARYSWMKPSTPKRITMERMAIPSVKSPRRKERKAAAIKIRIMGSMNWASSMRQAGREIVSCNSFGPWAARRSVASAEERPSAEDRRKARIPSEGIVCGELMALLSIYEKSALSAPDIERNWRRGSGSNRCIRILQTLALPLGYRAIHVGGEDNGGEALCQPGLREKPPLTEGREP